MRAERSTPGCDVVLGVGEFAAKANSLVLCRAHSPKCKVHARKRCLAFNESKGLRDGELEWESQQLVEHSGRCLAWIILDRDHGDELARACASSTEFKRILTETHAPIRKVISKVLHQ